MKIVEFFTGNQQRRAVSRMKPLVQAVNQLEPKYEQFTDEQLRETTKELRKRFNEAWQKVSRQVEQEIEREVDDSRHQKIRQRAEQKILATLLPDAFAAVREAAKRTMGMRHFDEQLMGGMVLHEGKIAEMKTGEGKTLVATLPAYLNAIPGHGVHVVTVNDYLARRDAHWMGQVYDALGMTVGAIGHEQSWQYTKEEWAPPVKEETDEKKEDAPKPANDWPHLRPITRHEAYRCDITYGTNNEYGFDFLRDNMVQHPSQLRQRELWYAIVDEVDSILIDEARTPLIISQPAEESTNLYQTFAQIARRLKPEQDFTIDEKMRAVSITDEGIKHVEEWTGVANLYAPEHVQLVHHLEEALKAQALFSRDKDYVVKDGEVVIVDEFTGRLMPGRRYNEGLHQAIEAKEQVEIQRESDTLATISFQNLFRLYAKLSGMTGTAMTEVEEFWKIYQTEVVEIPTHRQLARIDHQDLIYKSEAGKLKAVIEEIRKRSELGQPVLVGTISIEKNEQLSKLLKQEGIKHQVLNAKQHEREAKVIANAGKSGAVTLATNMAGRGVDIILGGEQPKTDKDDAAWKVWEAEHQKVLELGGLFVLGTERHEARRIDNQLRGRAGRQGDNGESQFYVSMEDDLMRIFGGERMVSLMNRLGVEEDMPVQAKMISGAIESAQRRVEGHNFDIRKHLVEYDDVMDKHREFIYRRRRRILNDLPKVVVVDGIEPEYDDKGNIIDSYKVNLHQETLDLMDEAQRAAYEEKITKWPAGNAEQVERLVWLRTIDTLWIEHLNAMEALRAGIGLRGYGQHDPLVAYREEGYRLFQRLQKGIEQEVVNVLMNLELSGPAAPQPVAEEQKQLKFSGASDSQSAGFEGDSTTEPQVSGSTGSSDPAAGGDKIGRNDLCPCGSGKKYKKCHGK